MIDRTQFHAFDVETAFVVRLAKLGRSITVGCTDHEIRKERIRSAIIQTGVASRIIGEFAGSRKAETFQELFERHYGEPLLLTAKPKGEQKC